MDGDLVSRYNRFRARRDWERSNDIARIDRKKAGRTAEPSESLPLKSAPIVINFVVTGAGKIKHTTDETNRYVNDYEQVSMDMWEEMWRPNIIRHCQNAWERKRVVSMRAVSYSRALTSCCILREEESFEESVFVINIVLLRPLRKALDNSKTVFKNGNQTIDWQKFHAVSDDEDDVHTLEYGA